MAKKSTTNSSTHSTDTPHTTVKRVGGFAVGDTIVVDAKGSTYFGKKGVVAKFCENGSHQSLYVRLAGEKKDRCLRVKSIASAKPDVEIPTGCTQSDNESATSTESRGRRVLTLYEYLEDLKSEYKDDEELCNKLKEVIKLVLAINI